MASVLSWGVRVRARSYIVFKEEESVEKALQLNNKLVDEKHIRVDRIAAKDAVKTVRRHRHRHRRATPRAHRQAPQPNAEFCVRVPAPCARTTRRNRFSSATCHSVSRDLALHTTPRERAPVRPRCPACARLTRGAGPRGA